MRNGSDLQDDQLISRSVFAPGTHGIWAKDGVRAIWFTIKTDHSVLVPVLIQV